MAEPLTTLTTIAIAYVNHLTLADFARIFSAALFCQLRPTRLGVPRRSVPQQRWVFALKLATFPCHAVTHKDRVQRVV